MIRTIRRKTMIELKQAIYDANGWVRRPGESMTKRISEIYDVRADHRRGDFVATPCAEPEA